MALDKDRLIALQQETAERGAVLVAVSKTRSADDIRQALEAGQHLFGENYTRELVDKHAVLPSSIQWHFIGHLQSNKVKTIAPFVSLIHGVDSAGLLKEINKQAERHQRTIDCLLQIHIAKEETKFGFSMEEAEALILSEASLSLKNIRLKGLMGMATNTGDESQIATEFRGLAAFYERMKAFHADFSILSMGMTSDYRIALDAGSTMVRIGSAIFGER